MGLNFVPSKSHPSKDGSAMSNVLWPTGQINIYFEEPNLEVKRFGNSGTGRQETKISILSVTLFPPEAPE